MQINEEYFASEEFQNVLERYEASISTGEVPFMDADDLVDIADYYSSQDNPDSANQAINYALDFYPGSTLPNVFKARQALMVENYADAQVHAEAIEDKDDPDYHYLMAEIMIAEGDVEEADKYLCEYGKTVEPDEYEDFIRDCANLYIDYNLSEKAYEWMLRSKGDESDDFKELMARTLFGLGKYHDSERIYNELVNQHPYSKQYWNALAHAQYMNENYSDSIISSEFVIAIDPNDIEGVNSKASGLMRLGNYEEALKYFKRYSELVPDDEYGLLHQGVCLVNTNKNQEAISVLQQASLVAPPDSPFMAQIYQELAFCYGAEHEVEKALQMIDKTETLECDHTDMEVIRGHILLQNNLIMEAQEAFKLAIIKSNYAPGIVLRIIVSLYDNRYTEACYQMLLKFFSHIKEYEPDFRGGNAYMALCCYDLGRKKEFIKYLKLAVELDPHEAQSVLSSLFPEGMSIEEYVAYMEKRMK